MNDDPQKPSAEGTPITPQSDDLESLDMSDLDFDDLELDALEDDLVAPITAPANNAESLDESAPEFDDPFDDEWDEFDDPLPDMPQFDGPQARPDAAMPVRRRSFLQKNFNVIVIGVAIIAAILIFAYLMNKPSPQTTNNVPVAAILPDDVPAAEQPVATNEPQPLIPEAVLIQEAPTPQPELDLNTAPPMPSPITVPETSNENAAIDLSTLAPVTSSPSLSNEAPEQLDIASWEDMLAEEAAIEDAQDAPPTPQPILTDTTEEVVSTPAVEQTQEAAPTIVDNSAAMTAQKEALDAMTAAAQSASEEAERLQSLLKQRNAEIATLQETLANKERALKAEQDKLAAEKAKKVQTPEPVKATPPKTTSTKTVKKKQTRRVDWVLRAAQPDMAVIAPRGTNNLQSISVGSNVSGLGRITSIAQENGRWVIRGTLSTLTQ